MAVDRPQFQKVVQRWWVVIEHHIPSTCHIDFGVRARIRATGMGLCHCMMKIYPEKVVANSRFRWTVYENKSCLIMLKLHAKRTLCETWMRFPPVHQTIAAFSKQALTCKPCMIYNNYKHTSFTLPFDGWLFEPEMEDGRLSSRHSLWALRNSPRMSRHASYMFMHACSQLSLSLKIYRELQIWPFVLGHLTHKTPTVQNLKCGILKTHSTGYTPFKYAVTYTYI